MNKNVRWVVNIWKEHKLYIVLLFVLTFLSTAVTIAYPYMFKSIIDTYRDILLNPDKYPSPRKEIVKIIQILLVIGFVKMLASTYPAFRAFMNLVFEYTLRMKYFRHILKKDYRFFNQFRTGDLVTRLTNDLTDFPKIGWFLCSGIFRALDSFSKIVFCIAIMFFMSWKLTLLTLLPVPIMISIFYITSNKLYSSFKTNQEAVSEINNQLEMSFSGVKIIKSFVCEDKYKRFFDVALKKRFDSEIDVIRLNTRLQMVYEYINQIAQIGLILFGGFLVVKGEITVGTFYAFYTYLSMLIYPILDLPQLFVSGKQAFVNIDRLEEIKDYPYLTENSENKKKTNTINKIEFVNVSFSYNLQRTIVNDISFSIKKGDHLLILGPVGSGKTTLVELLSGVLRPTFGDIRINDIALSEYKISDYREKLGFVPQEPLLFSGSIKQNICFGKNDVTQNDIEIATETAQMRDEVNQLTNGFETRIGQKGVSLSGGQKQRIAIARALLKNPELLIFDDITASLDADNEEKLWKDIRKNYGEITSIIISNRISTLRYVNNVIFLDKGSISGIGSHEELMNSNVNYSEFIKSHTDSHQ